MRGADLPFAPRRLPFFYGWLLLAIATLGILASIPGQTMGISVFTDALLEATGLSRLAVSQAYLAGTLLSGLTLPWAGSRVDRFGARPAATFAAVGLGVTLVYLSAIDRVAAALGGGAVTAALLLTAGFYAVRFTGQGLLTMVSRALIGRWFDRRRGLASGLSGVFVGFGFGVAPQVLDAWIAAAGWRGAWQQIALVVTLGMGGLVLLFYRSDPESCGLAPDGDASAPSPDGAVAEVPGYTRGQAIRTAAFWAVTAGLACHALVVTGVTFHIVDIGATAGLTRADAVQVFLPMAVVSTVTGLVGGWLADRVSVRSLLLALLLFEALGIVGCVDLSGRFWLVVVGFGVGGGLFNPIGTVAYPRFFGRAHLGAILGVEMMSLVIGSAVGPVFLATAKDVTGGYAAGLYAALGFPVVAALLAATFPRPDPAPPG